MFKCTVCQKLYTSQVKYCECGNDEFVYVEESAPVSYKENIQRVDFISLGIFVVCIILSIWVLFFFTPVKSRHHAPSQPDTTLTTNENVSIPDINKIWNDTPAYVVQGESGSAMEVYKKSLQNMLNSNITPKQFNGSGRCEIEFTVNNNGKLLNRKMFKGEGSSEFNKIVLNMLTNTNETRVPPSDYLGETIHGEVIVQDGLIKLYIK